MRLLRGICIFYLFFAHFIAMSAPHPIVKHVNYFINEKGSVYKLIDVYVDRYNVSNEFHTYELRKMTDNFAKYDFRYQNHCFLLSEDNIQQLRFEVNRFKWVTHVNLRKQNEKIYQKYRNYYSTPPVPSFPFKIVRAPIHNPKRRPIVLRGLGIEHDRCLDLQRNRTLFERI